MSTSSEEVLLIVNHVKHKKSEGNLYVMGARLGWMPGTKDSFTISKHYADIRAQKISPDSKEKVQLQVVMHDSGADTFHFANPGGRDAQKRDREGVKELLQQLLPKFRNKVNSELEQKNRMLQEDPELFQLYKDLVVSGVVSCDEFWANRVNQQQAKASTRQEVGVSAAFLADIKPQTDGCNGLKYNLTPDVIESIFRTYPAVRKKHAECVPDKLTEAEFWTRFFQSHYFHRDRINISSKDLFADCVKSDEDEIRGEMTRPASDLLVDLTGMSDGVSSEGYGTETNDEKPSVNQVNASLIRRFNQHSTLVLKACSKHPSTSSSQSSNPSSSSSASSSSSTSAPITNGISNSLGSNGAVGEPPPNKKSKMIEKLEYTDLKKEDDGNNGPVLKLGKLDRYLHGPTPAVVSVYNSTQDVIQACTSLNEEVDVWEPKLTQVLAENAAMSILSELSPGGTLMKGHTQQQLHQLIPSEMQEEVKNLYNALGELLRHFWACFPTTTPFLEEKVVRMRTNLERFQMFKLTPVKEKLHSYHYSINMVGHMEEMLASAYNKFNTWQARRKNKR